ncbi:hypothetical protein [Actinoplanes sp. CA-252034]|uniref:hypothetical protein n=1 Tax=Actinoplanes sp. CA-252034 TaxID=3239906 RepID=UPI003D989DDC
MTHQSGSHRARFVASATAFALFVVAGCTAGEKEAGEQQRSTAAVAPVTAPSAEASPSASEAPRLRDGWKTVEYRDVRVDVPADWVQPDGTGCELRFERWAPPGAPPCRMTVGVVFYGAATFDPAHRPGVRKSEGETWAGYVYAGELAVYAAGPDRELVQDVLDTARPPAVR